MYEFFQENSRSRPGTECKRASTRLGCTVEFRALLQPLSKLHAKWITQNPDIPRPISFSTFRKIKPINIVKQFRASDLCSYCFDLPRIERELAKFKKQASNELKSDDPEQLLTCNCFSEFEVEKIYQLLIERRRNRRHQNHAHRQRQNNKYRIVVLSQGNDLNKIIIMVDFKQNMGPIVKVSLVLHVQKAMTFST